jgi:hypothetical protein
MWKEIGYISSVLVLIGSLASTNVTVILWAAAYLSVTILIRVIDIIKRQRIDKDNDR